MVNLSSIDLRLKKIENTSSRLRIKTTNFLNSVCDAVQLPHGALFDHDNKTKEKKFIAVCLLRLLCCNSGAIWDNIELRIKTFKLFDDQIGPILYNRLGLIENSQNHEKLDKLCEVEKDVLGDFDNITASLVSLDTGLSKTRQQFLEALNVSTNKLFIEQFVIPLSLINIRYINSIFEAAEAYNKSSIENRLDTYQNTKTLLEDFLSKAEENPSIFTKRCIIAPMKKIYDYIQKDFKENDAIKPATVIISPLDRKYPFHVIDRKIELKFRVENQGPGYALDVQIECELEENLASSNPVNLENLSQYQRSEIILETTIEKIKKGKSIVISQISWQNFDKKRVSKEFIFELMPQRTDLNWEDIESQQPYSLEAVNEAEDLVGRTQLMRRLKARLSANRIASSIIHGQKRVGKTSIAEVVQANFKDFPDYSVIPVPINSLDTTTPDKFVEGLGKSIVEEVSYLSASFRHIETPQFESALAPLLDYFRNAHRISPAHKFIITLDEFDEIPPDMVQLGSSVGQTFFNNIRAISSTGYVGFVLVGGENMQTIIESTDQLNKMTTFRVDSFDKENYWSDFQDLVRQPLKDTIEFNDKAIHALYEMTEGHPFYTKAICSEVYTTACEARSAYISEDDIERAVQVIVDSLDLNQVSHFWIDGISKRLDHAQRDEIRTQRRKFLIAFAQIKRRKASVSKQELRDSELLVTVDVDRIIDQYITRGFLIGEADGYRWKPKLFERWLIGRGFSMLTGDFSDEEAIIQLRQKEEEAYVIDREIVDLCSRWGLYQGSAITPPHVRTWLNQFEYNTQQKLMFNLLNHVDFYDYGKIGERISRLHKRVQEEIAQMGGSRPGDKRRRRDDILLSSFGPPSKSGASYARIYANENNIFIENEVCFDEIQNTLKVNDQIKAIVFVDDIIASGGSAVASLDDLNTKCGELLRKKNVKVFISAICGLNRGIEKVKSKIKKVPFEADVIVGDPLSERDQCFSGRSKVFSSPDDRQKAKQIVSHYGQKLEKKHPLGYQDGQLLVVFQDNCPNNTLPILWKELNTSQVKWRSLFKRT